MSSTRRAPSPNPLNTLAAAAVGVTLAGVAAAPAFGADIDTETEVSGVTVRGAHAGEVSSDKFTAPLVDTPQTVQVIPQEVFNQQGARNLTEALRNTPGITFNAGENGFASGLSNFSMRGVDTTGSVFVDGVRDSGNYSRDTFNVEQVEVVKGAAADNGRGSAGGYVNVVSKTPKAAAAYSGTASLGLDDYDSETRTRVTADLNMPFSDTAAVRLNLLYEDGGVPGRDVASRSSLGFAPSVAFGLGTGLRFIAAYQHVKQEDLPDWGVPAVIFDGMWRYQPSLDGKAIRDNFYGLSSDYDDVTSDSVLGRVEYDFGANLVLSNQTRWSQTERDARYTVVSGYTHGTGVVAAQRQGYWRENTALSNQTNLTARVGAHAIAAGLELSREESSALHFATENVATGTLIGAPDPDRAGPWANAANQRSKVQVDTIAAYIYDTFTINPQWSLTGGLRVEKYDVEIESRTMTGVPELGDGTEIGETTVSGKFGVIYKPTENASLYASVGVAALPGGSFLSNPDISRENDAAFPGILTGINSADAKPQHSVNYEIGAKWNFFDNRLATTAAVFRTERQNVAITGRNPDVPQTPAPPTILLGYGEQILQGLEIGFAGQITPQWSVFGGVLLMDSEREHSAFLDEGRRLANATDYAPASPAPGYTARTRTSGDELAFTPNESANIWTTYRLPSGWTFGLGAQYVGDAFVGRPDDAERIIPNGAAGKLPGYTVVNGLVQYEINENVTFRVNVDNLTDELYAVSTNWSAQRAFMGAPRSILFSLDLKM